MTLPLSKRPVLDIMTDHVMTISQDETIQEAAAIMMEYKEPCLVVMKKMKMGSWF